MDFEGKTALVTGASSGMGVAWAEALAARGANVVLAARSRAELDAVAKRIRQRHNVSADVVVSDLAEPDGPQLLHEAVSDRRIDVLINNAGFGLSGPFLGHALADEERQVALDVHAVLALCHLFGSDMRSISGQTAIVNIASNAAFQPLPYSAVYAASKSFVLLFSEALHRELHGQGTRVLAVCPGPVNTPFWGKIGSDLPDSAMTSPQKIVADALKALDRGRTFVVPGPLGIRVQAQLPRFAPRSWVVRVSDGASRRIMMRGRTVTD